MKFLKKKLKEKQLMLLDGALKKLVELNIAVITSEKYQYSQQFECTTKDIISNPPGKLKQIKFAQEAGRKLIPEFIALAITKPSRRDIENLIIAYVCLKIYINEYRLNVSKNIVPDLAYAVWYLNDNNPTKDEVEEWNLT